MSDRPARRGIHIRAMSAPTATQTPTRIGRTLENGGFGLCPSFDESNSPGASSSRSEVSACSSALLGNEGGGRVRSIECKRVTLRNSARLAGSPTHLRHCLSSPRGNVKFCRPSKYHLRAWRRRSSWGLTSQFVPLIALPPSGDPHNSGDPRALDDTPRSLRRGSARPVV